jgi:hypothetical protein
MDTVHQLALVSLEVYSYTYVTEIAMMRCFGHVILHVVGSRICFWWLSNMLARIIPQPTMANGLGRHVIVGSRKGTFGTADCERALAHLLTKVSLAEPG